MHGMDGGEIGLDDDHAAATNASIDATIMGRNMFRPVRARGAAVEAALERTVEAADGRDVSLGDGAAVPCAPGCSVSLRDQ